MSCESELSGQLFGELLVLYEVGKDEGGHILWLCECSCGKEIKVRIYDFKTGRVKSCGCKKIKHGHSRSKKVTTEYNIWRSMIKRCHCPNNKDYCRYGGRGIKVCDRWLKSFENFLEDMGYRPSSKHSLDRINNDGNYCKENCRWANSHEQNRNMRNNNWQEYKGTKLILSDWSRLLKIHHSSIQWRLKEGQSFDSIVEYYINKNDIILSGGTNEETL